MKTSTITKIGTVAVAAASISLAGAQSNGATGLSARIGVFLPTNSLGSDLGTAWTAFGLDYKISTLSASVPGVGTQSYFGISADYYSFGGDNDLPVALTYNLRQGPVVFSAGIGPDFRNAGDLTGNGVGLGEQVAVAYDLGSGSVPLFIEAKYFFSSRPELNGAAVYLGVRF